MASGMNITASAVRETEVHRLVSVAESIYERLTLANGSLRDTKERVLGSSPEVDTKASVTPVPSGSLGQLEARLQALAAVAEETNRIADQLSRL